ncbi:MAG TPA: gamma-glutamyltransferase, partial [Dehalococcoidia bacterium]|nr:gamma-glutamyltransferase [Dehalococcoidia bacterium]
MVDQGTNGVRPAGGGVARRRTRYRPIRGTHAAIVAGHPAAVAAGARMLDRGGNAVDAIIATAAALSVVRPHMCGIAGDGFLLIHDAASGRNHAILAGGPAPATASPDRFPGGIPNVGPHISTVPGIVDGWGVALDRFGTLSWEEVLQPAIELADRGFPLYESLASWIAHYRGKYAADPACAAVLLPGGRPPLAGELIVQKDLARTLRLLAQGGPRAFYEGEIAATYAAYLQGNGGLTTSDDLRRYHATVAEPIAASYRGYTISTQPPLSQGWMVLQMLGALEGVDLADLGHESGRRVAALARAVQASFEDRQTLFGDPAFVPFSLDQVLSPARISEIRDRVRRGAPAGGSLSVAGGASDTTSLSAVDAQGNAVSMIQSLWVDAGVMVPGTG